MALPPAHRRTSRALAVPIALALAGALLHVPAAEGAPGTAAKDEPACAGRWETSGAVRTRRSRLRGWRVTLDLPRASAACSGMFERQLLDELARDLPSPTQPELAAAVECHLAHAHGDELAWACALNWRGEARAPMSAIVGISAIGSAQGLRFEGPFPGCGPEARKAIVAAAIDALPPRLREAATDAARTSPGLLTTYREGDTIRVSFGRALPSERTEGTVARVPWERMITLCGAHD